MSDLDRFIAATILDLDAAGALADYLDEIDPPALDRRGFKKLSRGALVRRRWMKWKMDRSQSPEQGLHQAALCSLIFKFPLSEKEIASSASTFAGWCDKDFLEWLRRFFKTNAPTETESKTP